MEKYFGRGLIEGEPRYFEVLEIKKGMATVLTFDEYADEFELPVETIECVEPVPVDEEKLSRFMRYEIGIDELSPEGLPPELLSREELYHVSMKDLLSAIKRGKDVPIDLFREEWLEPVIYRLNFLFRPEETEEEEGETRVDGYRFLPTEDKMVDDILCEMDEALDDDEEFPLDVWLKPVRNYVDTCGKPVPKRAYPNPVKRDYIHAFEPSYMLDAATDFEIALFRQYLGELCAAGDFDAMRVKAFACYGGNRAYACDWVTARNLLLRVMEAECDPGAANALGYIYYYGRCTGGKPDYAKAFYYFSIGAAGGLHESRYKMADMFMKGQAVPKSREMAVNILTTLYQISRMALLEGEIGGKLADVALRLGRMVEERPNIALYFYLQARFALRMRRLETDEYGDDVVAENIEKAIAGLLPKTDFPEAVAYCFDDPEEFLKNTHAAESMMEMRLSGGKDGRRAQIRLIPKEYNEMHKFFVTAVPKHFCGYLETLDLYTDEELSVEIGGKAMCGESAVVRFDDVFYNMDSWKLLCGDETVATLSGDVTWTLELPETETEKRYNFVSVFIPEFKHRRDYLVGGPEVKPGDEVLVQISDMEYRGIVVGLIERRESECVKPIGEYTTVLKKL